MRFSELVSATLTASDQSHDLPAEEKGDYYYMHLKSADLSKEDKNTLSVVGKERKCISVDCQEYAEELVEEEFNVVGGGSETATPLPSPQKSSMPKDYHFNDEIGKVVADQIEIDREAEKTVVEEFPLLDQISDRAKRGEITQEQAKKLIKDRISEIVKLARGRAYNPQGSFYFYVDPQHKQLFNLPVPRDGVYGSKYDVESELRKIGAYLADPKTVEWPISANGIESDVIKRMADQIFALKNKPAK